MQPNIRSNEFFRRALTWLRSQQSFATKVLPEHAIDPGATGTAQVRGWLVRRSSSGSWSFAGLCGVALGTLLTMFNPPAVHAKTRSSVHRVGYAVNAGAIGCFAVGEVIRRRSRIRALVELRSATSPTTPSSVEMLREEGDAGEVWIVSERPCADDVVVEAAHRGVRCFIEGPGGFEEVAAPHEHDARRRMDA